MLARPRRGVTALASLVALTAPMFAGSGPAGASAAPTTERNHGLVQTFYDTKPCSDDGIGYEITTTTNSVDHEAETDIGGHYSFTEEGTFTARPAAVVRDADGNPIRNDDDQLDPALDPNGNVVYLNGPTYTGHVADWGGGNVTKGGSQFTFTFSVNGVGSDGSTFGAHSVFHSTAWPGDPEDPSLVKVMFQHETCR